MLGDGANLLTDTGSCGLKESSYIAYIVLSVHVYDTCPFAYSSLYTSRLIRSENWLRGWANSLKVNANGGIKEFKCWWEKVFMKWNIPEPELSVRFILDHVWQTTTGNRAAVSGIWLVL